MSEQALDLKRTVQIVRRHLIVVGAVAFLGLIAGIGYTVIRPPLFSSVAWVEVQTRSGISTQVVVAGSDPVLNDARRFIQPPVSLATLRQRVLVSTFNPTVLSVSAQGESARQAEGTANAVAHSYVLYVASNSSTIGSVQARILNSAAYATQPSIVLHGVAYGVIGVVAGFVLGALGALAVSRNERRLRRRDDIADSVGVPVIASLPVRHPSSAASWSLLLETYRPSTADAWRIHNALQYLNVSETIARAGEYSLVVLTLGADKRALALGPQLAVCATAEAIPTCLVSGPHQDAKAAAMLRTACAATQLISGQLKLAVADRGQVQGRPRALTVIVIVVDARNPEVPDGLRPTATVLGVSPGATTPDLLAQVAASAAAAGCPIEGILVADPDHADPTTGRIPRMARPTHHRQPTRLTRTSTQARRRATETSR